MKASRTLSRRSFVAKVAGGMIATGGAAALIVGPAHAQNYSGVTDCDSGNACGNDRDQDAGSKGNRLLHV